MTTTLVPLALAVLLAQAPASESATAPGHATTPEHAAAEHANPGHADAGAADHGGGHDESLGAVMMHHVVDGYTMEHPGVCHGGFAWNCEIDLRQVFGTKVDPATGKNASGPLVFGALDLTPTKHVVMMWIAALLLFVITVLAAGKRSVVPKGLYNFVEMLVQFVRNEIAVPNIGAKDANRFLPYLVTAFFFILIMNLLGLVPFAATATANLSVTVMLALFTFFVTQWAAIRSMGIGGYLGHLTGGVPKSLWPLWAIMIPVEFLGLFTKPFALTVRLFANMVAGHFVILALLGLIFALGSPLVAAGSVPMALAIYLLELFVAFVQAYIFTMLSSLFIGAGLAHHGDEHGHEHGEHGHGHAGPGMGSEHGAGASHVAGAAPGHG